MSSKQIQARIAKLNERIKSRSDELGKLREQKKKLHGDLTTARASEKAKKATGGKKKKTKSSKKGGGNFGGG